MRRLLASLLLLLPLSARSAGAESVPGKIVFVGVDHQIYVVDPNGGDPQALTRGEAGRLASLHFKPASVSEEREPPYGEQRYSWPTWAPDGRSLLLQSVRLRGDGVATSAGVYTVSLDHPGAIRPLYQEPRKTPIYTYWAPTGERAAVVAVDREQLELSIVEIESGEVRPVTSGVPLYFAWRGDGRVLATHVGGAAVEDRAAEVSLIDVSDPKVRVPELRKISDRPVAFRAPGWSPDGAQLAYAARSERRAGANLVVASGSATEEREVAAISSRAVFSWLPDGRAISVAEAAAPGVSLYAGINLIRVSDGGREPLFAGALGAFFLAPDGKRILLAVPDFDSGEWSWIVVEIATRRTREVARFLPSPEFQMLMLHFDQFALSHRLWAPDSRHFVFSSYAAPRPADGESTSPGVWLVDSRTATLRRIADGRNAFWSPR